MKVYDISRPISTEMEIYPGDPTTTVSVAADKRAAGGARLTFLQMCVHAGTHVDAPSHFLAEGADIECVDVQALCGRVEVVEFETFLRERPCYKKVLVKGHQPLLQWPEDLAMPAMIGVDHMSVGKGDTHRALLSHGTVILEGLNLEAVPPGTYRLTCLPLLIPGSDGAPARAILRAYS